MITPLKRSGMARVLKGSHSELAIWPTSDRMAAEMGLILKGLEALRRV